MERPFMDPTTAEAKVPAHSTSTIVTLAGAK
jgi:hypothetical protein